jgi:hypothetical protein
MTLASAGMLAEILITIVARILDYSAVHCPFHLAYTQSSMMAKVDVSKQLVMEVLAWAEGSAVASGLPY